MSVLSRWTARLRIRRGLLKRARASVVYWGERAGSKRGRAMLAEARARYALRKHQVDYAERVVSRHKHVTTVSAKGLAMIAGFEGFRSCPYRDAVGRWTIGYGETQGIGPNTACWSRAFALHRFRSRVNHDYLAPVLQLADAIGLHLKQNEADALASLVYNTGPGIMGAHSAMGLAMRSKNTRRIADTFLTYRFAGGRPILLARRKRERAYFLR